MNLLERLEGILKNVSYKPGWTITVAPFRIGMNGPFFYASCNLMVMWTAKDVERPGEDVSLCLVKPVHGFQIERLSDEEIVDQYVRSLIREAELHELDEWLKYNNVCVHEPHPKERE
jgi:hypothetical protein